MKRVRLSLAHVVIAEFSERSLSSNLLNLGRAASRVTNQVGRNAIDYMLVRLTIIELDVAAFLVLHH